MNKPLKIAGYILSVFLVSTILGILSAHTPYVPFEHLEKQIFIWASLIVFFLFILVFSLYSGSKSDPAGFKLLSKLWQNNEYKKVVKFWLYLPVGSMLMGYFTYFLAATLPSYPTNQLVENIEYIQAKCVGNGRDRYRGVWSEFKTERDSIWKVAGFGKICNSQTPKTCNLGYSTGTLGYYIRTIRCS
jgi:hypothetical protein